MKKVRLGILGMGNMGSGHLENILCGRCPEIEVTAVCDLNPARLEFALGRLAAKRAEAVAAAEAAVAAEAPKAEEAAPAAE